MNKKEISEIKKQFSPNNCAITRICGCYVDGEKNKKTELKEAFLSLSEEEMFKYFEIFKKTLSGTIGKNLINMDFPLEQEKEGGTQEFLMKLRGSKLQDNAILEEFYDKIIENYDYGENYYIILIHAVYDIPGKSSDGQEMFDASDEIYDHILCSICPVNLSKAGLCYNAETNNIEDRIRDWIVEMPDLGFLFPVFNDRSTDIHSLLYYTKNAEQLRSAFVDEMFGCTTPLSAGGQRDSFNALVEETLGEDCASLENLKTHGMLRGKSMKEFANKYAKQMSTKMTGVDQFVSALSGGNKQKVVLARWVGKDSDLIILDSPTRGIDVKVKADIYAMMTDMRKSGKSIIMISEEIMELLGMADRILIMKDGKINGEFLRSPELKDTDLIDNMI